MHTMGEMRHRTPAAAHDHEHTHHRGDDEGGGMLGGGLPTMPDEQEHAPATMNVPPTSTGRSTPERRAGTTGTTSRSSSGSSRQKTKDGRTLPSCSRAKCSSSSSCCCAPSGAHFHFSGVRAIALTVLVVVVGLQVLIIAVGIMSASTANQADSAMYLMSMLPPSVSRSLQTVTDLATSATSSLHAPAIGGGGGNLLHADQPPDARPFVVTSPNGLTVRSHLAQTSTVAASSEISIMGTLPFGSIVLLVHVHRWTYPDWWSAWSPLSVSTPSQDTSTTICMQMIYPYEGYVDVFQGNNVKPLVGTIDREQQKQDQQQDPTREEASEIQCCDSRSNSNGTDSSHRASTSITWEEYRNGAYNAEGDSPQWTIQYQPPSTRGDDSALPTPPWMAPTWLDQVPIGSGRDGALVGSTASASVVPISTAALFVPPPVAAAGKVKSPSAFGKSKQERKPDDGRLFAAAREALLRGDHGEANRLIGQLQAESSRENPFASLEYAADLIVAFTAHPLQFRSHAVNNNDEKSAMQTQTQRRLKRASAAERAADRIRRTKTAAVAGAGSVGGEPSGRWQRDRSARGVLIENLISTVEARGTNLTAVHGMEDRLEQISPYPLRPLLERGQLDLQRGIYSESFVVASNTQDFVNSLVVQQSHANAPSINNTRQRSQRSDRRLLHHREYFAALEEHIIASRFKCHGLPSSSETRDEDRSQKISNLFSRRQKQTPNCLNMAMALSRSDASKSSVSSIAWSELISANQTTFEKGSTKEGSHPPRRKYVRGMIGVSLRSNSAPTSEVAPDVEVCGIVTCYGNANIAMTMSEDGKVTCSSSSSAEVFVAIELQSKGNDVQRDNGVMRSTDQMKVDCQTRLFRALEAGYDALRERHVNKFNQSMSEMDFRFIEKNEKEGRTLRACDGSASSVKPSKNLSCKAKEENPHVTSADTGALSPSQLRRQFQFSRYLMLSAAASSVPNLQFWVDGPVSAWSGDYHLNVNLQMMYWGSGPAALRATHRPLGPFVKSLAEVGRKAAQRMYNCSGDAWVAHGNTDHTLGGDLRADSFWVFCSTCGIWVALQLFEDFLFSPFDKSQAIDIVNALSVLRGAAHFFQQATFVDPITGIRQTGPTTSPENSYLVFRNSSTLSAIRNVTSTSSKTVFMAPNDSTVIAGDSSNGTVLVNKTTDVATWKLVATNQTLPAKSWTQHLSFTTSFDASLVRQLANSFPLLVRWSQDVLDESLYIDSVQESDKSLASDLVKLARSLPNQANPIVGKSNTLLEYPSPMSSCSRHDELPYEVLSEEVSPTCYAENGGNDTTPLLVAESPDTGHRHFSGMHWLYPNTFFPLRNGEEILNASVKTLEQKRKAGGGHTGWSASWLAALSARLRDGNGAWTAISRLLLHYTTKNGLDLHPPLASLPTDSYTTQNSIPIQPKKCDTCFYEKDMNAQGSAFASSMGRGLETSRSDKFQLDGHGGLIAAVSELLLMSHIPGNLLVLPGLSSLPLSLDGGMVRGVKARGDVSVSVSWTSIRNSISITSLDVLFASRHPWLFGLSWDESDGFYSAGSNDERKPMLRIYFPNDRSQEETFRLQASACISQLDEASFAASLGRIPSPLPPQLISGMTAVYLSINTFPCTATFR